MKKQGTRTTIKKTLAIIIFNLMISKRKQIDGLYFFSDSRMRWQIYLYWLDVNCFMPKLSSFKYSRKSINPSVTSVTGKSIILNGIRPRAIKTPLPTNQKWSFLGSFWPSYAIPYFLPGMNISTEYQNTVFL